MNIFYLNHNPKLCAEMHLDAHSIKMVLEYVQLLSTAHRVLDGTITVGTSKSGRKKTLYSLMDERDSILYSATHVNHPSAVWVRQSKENYLWLYSLLCELSKEYTYRYGKVHKCEAIGLIDKLAQFPNNLKSRGFTEPTPAMPDEYKVPGDSVSSYQNYYINSKQRMAKWTGKVNSRPVPAWFKFIESPQ